MFTLADINVDNTTVLVRMGSVLERWLYQQVVEVSEGSRAKVGGLSLCIL